MIFWYLDHFYFYFSEFCKNFQQVQTLPMFSNSSETWDLSFISLGNFCCTPWCDLNTFMVKYEKKNIMNNALDRVIVQGLCKHASQTDSSYMLAPAPVLWVSAWQPQSTLGFVPNWIGLSRRYLRNTAWAEVRE